MPSASFSEPVHAGLVRLSAVLFCLVVWWAVFKLLFGGQ